jgi:hypothetical protein
MKGNASSSFQSKPRRLILLLDQDRNLDMLGDAVGRQRELGLLIGDELDSHVQLIEETDEMVDRTDTRLRHAQKRLNHVGRRVKDNSKCQRARAGQPSLLSSN